MEGDGKMNAYDAIVIVLLLFAGVLGWKKGLLRTFAALLAVVFAMGVARIFSSPVATWLMAHTPLDTALQAWMRTHSGIEKWERQFSQWQGSGAPLWEGVWGPFLAEASGLLDAATRYVLLLVSGVVLFLVVWIGARVVLSILARVIGSLPFLGAINGIGGAFMGGAIALVWVLAVTLGIVLFFNRTEGALAVVSTSWCAQHVLPALGLERFFSLPTVFEWFVPLWSDGPISPQIET